VQKNNLTEQDEENKLLRCENEERECNYSTLTNSENCRTRIGRFFANEKNKLKSETKYNVENPNGVRELTVILEVSEDREERTTVAFGYEENVAVQQNLGFW